MSKRLRVILYILVVLAVWLGCMYVVTLMPTHDNAANRTQDSAFQQVSDRPMNERLVS